jgi:hypothetical protein
MLEGVYEKSNTECNIDIAFKHAADGTQQNDCRDLILDYLKAPSVDLGKALAVRLEGFTTGSSGHGLLFLISGKQGRENKFVISRFPADNGILAEENRSTLSVSFLERIFMKSAYSYKAALYQDASLTSGFWDGRCIDKQNNDPIKRISDYWINDFLASSLRVTSAAGTYRLATALRNATRSAKQLALKEELVAAVALAKGLKGRNTSVDEFMDRFGLSNAARDAIVRELPTPAVASETFQFNWTEFTTQVAYRSVELDSGAIVTAEASEFNDVVKRQKLDKDKVRLSVEGKVLNERLKKAS